MKKKLLILFLIFSVVAAAGIGVNYLLSLRKVTFVLEGDTDSIAVYSSNDKINDFSSNGNMLLQEGKYYVIPEGDNIEKDKIDFSVGDTDKTVTINPPYTKEFLNSLLSKEDAAIKAALATKYPSLINLYTLVQGTLYERGEWFGGLLTPNVGDPRDQRDAYRVVLHKEDGKWKVIRRPEYILTSSRYQEVPIDILRKINEIVE